MRRIPSPLTVGLALVLGASVGIAPVAAQDDDYQAALESGDLASLVPAAFADADDMTMDTLEHALPPADFDTDDGAVAREGLLALLDAAGVTLADAQGYSGLKVEGEDIFSFSAVRIPGIAAADWFELVYQISDFRSFTDPVRETIVVGPKEVLQVTSRGRDVSTLYYPQGEILWRMGGGTQAREFLAGLATIEGPALSVDPGGPVGDDSAATVGTADDPLSQIPAEIRGVATETQTFPAAALIDGVDPDDAEAVESAEALRALLESLGGVDKATFISSQAISDDGGLSIFGVSIDGADHADFSEALLETLILSTMDDPQFTQETLGGKPILRVTDGDSLFTEAATYVYSVGGTVWLLNGQEEWMAALLRTMP